MKLSVQRNKGASRHELGQVSKGQRVEAKGSSNEGHVICLKSLLDVGL